MSAYIKLNLGRLQELQLEELLLQRIKKQQQESDINKKSSYKLQWIATLRPFPNDLGGIRPMIRFMEMSWTSPLGILVAGCDRSERQSPPSSQLPPASLWTACTVSMLRRSMNEAISEHDWRGRPEAS